MQDFCKQQLFPVLTEAEKTNLRDGIWPRYPNQLVLAVVCRKDGLHIGNIGLVGIDYISRAAEFTVVIGDRVHWGKGLGKEAARLLCDHAFLSLNLNRISCGTFENNVAMCKLAAYLGIVVYLIGRRRAVEIEA